MNGLRTWGEEVEEVAEKPAAESGRVRESERNGINYLLTTEM